VHSGKKLHNDTVKNRQIEGRKTLYKNMSDIFHAALKNFIHDSLTS